MTAGAARHNEVLTASLDVDATPTKRFKSQDDSQYAGVGVEYRVLDWLQLRGGYHADMKSNDKNVVSAGFGVSPFNNRVHLDLAGSVGEDNTGAPWRSWASPSDNAGCAGNGAAFRQTPL